MFLKLLEPEFFALLIKEAFSFIGVLFTLVKKNLLPKSFILGGPM